MRKTIRHLCFVLWALSGCAAGMTAPMPGPTDCEIAASRVEQCAGARLDAPFSLDCSELEASQARSLVEELERSGCQGPMGQATGPLCEGWDPFGWCDEPAMPLPTQPTGTIVQYPIILAHGFNTSTTNFWRFNDVDVALRADGHVAVLGSVPPFDSPMVRAGYLAEQVDQLLEETGAQKVNLICFSQGGIDCRYLASPGGMNYGDRIATITTIGSPHRGTYIADVASMILEDPDSASARVIDLFTSWYGGTFSELAEDSHFVDAMHSMSEATMVEFNARIIDHPGVVYQSWAGFSYVGGLPNPRDTIETLCVNGRGESVLFWNEGQRDVMDALLAGATPFVAHGTELRPNDGGVTVESAKWGEFRGCLPADHLDLVGQINDRVPDRRTGFDYLRFYRFIASELAMMGY